MMNQYYGQPHRFNGRSGRDPRNGDFAPYRRPANRSNLSAYPYGNQGAARGGCGCGLGQDRPRSNGQMSNHDRANENPRTLPVMQSGGCGCGENRGVSPACQKLMEQIRAVDFALYEVILYLDVYPHSCDALETYHKLKAQKEALHREYEASCGPITAFGNESGTSWDWIGSPFPWEYGAE